jgi:hypothetical protein
MDIRKGATIAAALAGLLTGCAAEMEDAGTTAQGLKCEGGNECKGMSECAGKGKNDCQGMNECAGMGWVSVDTAAECEALGGTIAGDEA